MKTKLCLLMLLSFGLINAQKSADENSFTFSKSSDKKVDAFAFQGFGLEYYWPDLQEEIDGVNSLGIGISYEAYFPITKKSAITSNIAFRYFKLTEDSYNYDYTRYGLDNNYGFHLQLIKNFYVKPQLGFSYFTETFSYDGYEEQSEEAILDLTIGFQTGLIFKLKSQKPSFIDVGLSYQSLLGDNGSFFGIYTKYMFGK